MCVVDKVFANGEGQGISRCLAPQRPRSHEHEQERKADHDADPAKCHFGVRERRVTSDS